MTTGDIARSLPVVALKGADIERFIARPDPGRPIVLVYGQDAGLVHERVERMIKASVDDPNDPFSLVRLSGDDLASEPARLVEEANTIPLFGGRRAVWVKAEGRNFAAAVEALVAAAPPDCRIVIEAGDLRPSSPLRAICERAKNAVVLPCYVDDEKALGFLVDEEMRAAGMTISADARTALLPLLGGDRLASRSELQKLILYARGRGKIELADVVAVIADASTLALHELIEAAFAGRTGELEAQFAKTQVAGTSAGAIMSVALRQVAGLHRARLAVEDGMSASQVVGGMKPSVPISRRSTVEATLRTWSSERLERAMGQLADALLETRRQPALADAIAQRTLLSLAVNARRRTGAN